MTMMTGGGLWNLSVGEERQPYGFEVYVLETVKRKILTVYLIKIFEMT